ncbi:hypothetical protein [Bacillus sp. CHD6a]|uniref:hypothetical protein n=1 Tax=Bacillus sp. CHD6a TaxID=1643452 RepID=UPI000B0E15CE|nr:hypothetical protein [Bacillus sp. CHD6a]
MLHSNNKKDERNKKIKVKGLIMENKWNEAIKAELNKESVFRIVGLESELEADKLRKMREQVEVLSLKYNFPTKNDVANIAKLLIQIEEKIDRLEVQLQEETTPMGQHQEKKKVKVILEDIVERHAIISSLLGFDDKIIRSDQHE